jgi:hypothetical protein
MTEADRVVYIGGPVDRGFPDPRLVKWVATVLDQIRTEAEELGIDVQLPERNADLDDASPAAFYREIVRRIGGAVAVISVLGDRDAASVVESTLAGVYGKPQLIVARQNDDVPRVLQGMSSHTEVAASDEAESAIRSFLRRARDNDWEGPPRGRGAPLGGPPKVVRAPRVARRTQAG